MRPTLGTTSLGPMARMTKQRLAVIGELQKAGGEVRDKSGRAVALLHAKVGTGVSLKAMTNALSSMEDQGMVEREIRGKRTYAIRLTVSPVEADGTSSHEEELKEEQGPDQSASGGPVASSLDYRVLADALLTRVAEVIDQQTDKAELNQRLADLLADRERFRRQVGEVGDELRMVRAERDGLRTRLRQAEENIQRMLDPRNKVGMGDRHRRALERFMQATPRSR